MENVKISSLAEAVSLDASDVLVGNDGAVTKKFPGSLFATSVQFEGHVNATDNPHSVTATQVGLGDVDNVSASDLRDRSTHTGTQLASTISDFQSTVDADIDARVTKTFVDNLNIDADTLDGSDATAFATAAQVQGRVAGAANGLATLDANSKLSFDQIPSGIAGGLTYKGTWNASTNTPTLASGVGSAGDTYIVAVDGSTNLDGVSSWDVGDLVVFDGSVWQRVADYPTDVIIPDDGTIGSVSDPDALTIAANGDVTASQDFVVTGDLDTSNITVDDDGTIGSASDPNAITIDSSGRVGIGETSPVTQLDIETPYTNEIVRIRGYNPVWPGNVETTGISLGTSVATAGNQPQAAIRSALSNSSNSWAGTLRFYTNTSLGLTEKMRIDSSGNVGIGTTSPATALDVNGYVTASSIFIDDDGTIGSASDPDSIKIGSAGDVVIRQTLTIGDDVTPIGTLSVLNFTAPTFDNSTHAGEALFLRSGGTAGENNAQAVLAFGKADSTSRRSAAAIASIQTDSDTDRVGLAFYGSPSGGSAQTLTERARITHDGYLRLATGGIQFNGDTAAANALDDYEEGTWTPTVTPQTGSFTTITILDAHYTRIGRVVTAFAEWEITSVGTGSGGMSVTLPFSVDSEINRMFAGGRRVNDANFIHGRVNDSNDSVENITLANAASPIVDGNIYVLTTTYFTDA